MKIDYNQLEYSIQRTPNRESIYRQIYMDLKNKKIDLSIYNYKMLFYYIPNEEILKLFLDLYYEDGKRKLIYLYRQLLKYNNCRYINIWWDMIDDWDRKHLFNNFMGDIISLGYKHFNIWWDPKLIEDNTYLICFNMFILYLFEHRNIWYDKNRLSYFKELSDKQQYDIIFGIGGIISMKEKYFPEVWKMLSLEIKFRIFKQYNFKKLMNNKYKELWEKDYIKYKILRR